MSVPVPLGVGAHVVQPEVGTDIDDLHTVAQVGQAGLGARNLGQCGEDEVHALGDRLFNGDAPARQVRKLVADVLARGAPSRDTDQLGVGVLVEEAGQLDAGVARDIDDADFHAYRLFGFVDFI